MGAPKGQPGRAQKRAKVTLVRRKDKDDIYNDADRILGPVKSPIYDEALDLQAILHGMGVFPDTMPSEEIKRAISQFQEDGREGKHRKIWIEDAQEASEQRSQGLFDEFLQQKFRNDWLIEEDEDEDEEPAVPENWNRDSKRMSHSPSASNSKSPDASSTGIDPQTQTANSSECQIAEDKPLPPSQSPLGPQGSAGPNGCQQSPGYSHPKSNEQNSTCMPEKLPQLDQSAETVSHENVESPHDRIDMDLDG